ncbi:MAG: UbiD family decarboxylase, partial [Sulfolobales archaeon]
DMNLPPEGLFTGGIAIVSIRKRYPGHAKKVMMGLWGLGHMSLVKVIIVVDHDVNVHNLGEVLYAMSTCVDPQRDVLIIPGAVTDELDHTSQAQGYGSKLGIDATRKLPEENYGRPWPEEVKPDEETSRLVDSRWREYGIKI